MTVNNVLHCFLVKAISVITVFFRFSAIPANKGDQHAIITLKITD